MKVLKNSCFLIGVISVVIKQTCAVAVSQTNCKDGGPECDNIPMAVCDTRTTKCKCTTGYIEDTTNRDTCVKVLGLACTGNTSCSSDVHSLCKNNICACAVDYEEKNDICTQTVSSITCTASGKQCENVPNAECDVAAKKCKCSDGHVMNVDVCAAENAVLPVNRTTCTTSGKECDNVPNAECDATAKHCICSDGYVMNVGVCAPKNVAATLRIGAATHLFLVVLAVCN